jgi:hypothetical protein
MLSFDAPVSGGGRPRRPGPPLGRRSLIDQYWSAQASYIDPLAEVAGRDAIDQAIGAVQAQFPGFVFSAIGEPDQHHQQARFTWGLGPAGAEPLVIGFDVVVLDTEGRGSDQRHARIPGQGAAAEIHTNWTNGVVVLG